MTRPLRNAGLTVLVTFAAFFSAAAAPKEKKDGEYFEATSQKRFDDVEHWKRVFDDPKRDEWQKPAAVVEALELSAGMAVADLGAGTGYFMPYLSKAVGASGTVFAVDPEPKLVVHLRERAEKEGAANVVPILASLDNPRLPAGAVDIVLIVDTYHHIDDRLAYLMNLKRCLTEDGRIVVIDWKKEPMPVGPELDHRIARGRVIEELKRAGYTLAEEPKVLPYQYFLVFRPQ